MGILSDSPPQIPTTESGQQQQSHQAKKLYSELPPANMNQYSTSVSSPTQSSSSEIMVSSALQPLPPAPPQQTQLPQPQTCNYGPPSSDMWNESPPLCAGCRLRIEDKFYLSAVDVKWHSKCLKCAECGVELEQAQSCFEKDGLIFCKEDYLRIYNVNKCARCHLEIQPADLVMKAKQFLFHVDCFRCDTCGVVLKKGDLFGMYADHLYCQIHYDAAASDLNHQQPPHLPVIPHGPFTPDTMGHSPDAAGGGQHFSPGLHLPFPPSSVPYPPPPGSDPLGWYPPDFPPVGGPGSGEFQYDNNNEPLLKKRRGRKKRKVETFAAMNGYLEASGYPAGMDGQGGPGKTKRARTSFKHHQLRIMKHHFQINQNPDSRELKILSQKTQLDKKVLQVWFQNARAKWRRTRAQEPGGPSANHPNASVSSTSSGGLANPGEGGGNPDDPNDLGMGSPSSDCSGPMIPCC